MQQRQTAYKIWISDLINSEYIKQEGEWDPNYIQIRDLNVARVNLVANVVLTYSNEDGTYITLTIDDGSGQIQIKAWRDDTILVKDFKIGDTILVIGRIREYNSQIYLTPEIIRKLENPLWLKVRKLELTKLYGEPTRVQSSAPQQQTNPPQKTTPQQESTVVQQPTEQPQQTPAIEEQVVEETISSNQSTSESSRQKIMDLIEKNSTNENGVEMAMVIEQSGLSEEEAEKIMQDLMKEGEIFSPKPGFLKSI